MNTGSRDEKEMLAHIGQIAKALNRIANCAEASEMRAREESQSISKELERHYPNTKFDGATWCVCGYHTPYDLRFEEEHRTAFDDHIREVWHAKAKATTPEDIERMGEAVQAVRRGFEDLEKG